MTAEGVNPSLRHSIHQHYGYVARLVPTLASWRQGADLDIGAWMRPSNSRTPITIVSVAHFDDEERSLVLGVLLEEYLSWVRTLAGSQRLRALLVFDEVYGFLPPHPANPPTKRPLVALMKQARGAQRPLQQARVYGCPSTPHAAFAAQIRSPRRRFWHTSGRLAELGSGRLRCPMAGSKCQGQCDRKTSRRLKHRMVPWLHS
jgi:hypothetical protein